MPSDEALRVLWYARYPCSIFHRFRSRSSIIIFNAQQERCDVALAVPPPQFNTPGSAHAADE